MRALLPWARGSWFPVHGLRQDGSVTPGQVSCSEMGGGLSLEDVIKSLVRSQIVFSDSAKSTYIGSHPFAMQDVEPSDDRDANTGDSSKIRYVSPYEVSQQARPNNP